MDVEKLIGGVSRPARYLGGEAGQVVKDPAQVRFWLALAFPEIYEIAMSHLGIKILYESLAPRPEVATERVFMPWLDLLDILREKKLAPWSLESARPLNAFDAIGFSLQYELTYTNLLTMLQLAGIPLRSAERGPEHPIILAGGPCAVNPEPIADFLDLVVLGEAEELIHPLVDTLIQAKEEAWDRPTLYGRASQLEGVYAPALYRPRYAGGRLTGAEALEPAPARVRRRVVADMDAHQPPVRPITPWVQPVHDRLGVEVARGCTRGCRFCQAGFIYRPVRERRADSLLEAVCEGIAATGFEEAALVSLSTSDYTCIEDLAQALMDRLAPKHVSLSLPSLRVDTISENLAAQIKRVRKTGFTCAPEAGSERLRRVINKNLSEEQILAMAGRIFGLGWRHMKLYFMLGLPGETDDDVEAIGRLATLVADAAGGKKRSKRPLVHASLGLFVPKAHTPFQWEGQMDLAEARRRLHLAKSSLGDRRVRAKWNSPEQSILEGVLARGDRRLAGALELLVERGTCFDGWSEHLDYAAWLEALAQAGLGPEEYLRPREADEALPWDHLDVGVSREYLWAERQKALAGEATPDCRTGACLDCGVCDHKRIKPRLAAEPPATSAPSPVALGEPATYCFRLEKTGPARFLGHLEMISQLVRSFKRAGLELAHSQGFNPHPRLKTGSALPLGVESLVESLQVSLHGDPLPQTVAEAVNAALPSGLRLAEGRLRRPGEGLAEPDRVTYLVHSPATLDPERIASFSRADSLEMVRTTPKGERTIDLKAAVKEISLEHGRLTLVVGRAGGRPKPAEVLENVFGLSPHQAAGARALKIAASWGED